MSRLSGCAWCASEHGEFWDSLLADGVALSVVQELTPFSPGAALQHQRHSSVEPLAQPAQRTHSLADQIIRLASTTTAAAAVGEANPDTDFMRVLEDRAAGVRVLATSFALEPVDVEALLAEGEAQVRAAVRLHELGLPADPETVVWLLREEGGHRIADEMETLMQRKAQA